MTTNLPTDISVIGDNYFGATEVTFTAVTAFGRAAIAEIAGCDAAVSVSILRSSYGRMVDRLIGRGCVVRRA